MKCELCGEREASEKVPNTTFGVSGKGDNLVDHADLHVCRECAVTRLAAESRFQASARAYFKRRQAEGATPEQVTAELRDKVIDLMKRGLDPDLSID